MTHEPATPVDSSQQASAARVALKSRTTALDYSWKVKPAERGGFNWCVLFDGQYIGCGTETAHVAGTRKALDTITAAVERAKAGQVEMERADWDRLNDGELFE